MSTSPGGPPGGYGVIVSAATRAEDASRGSIAVFRSSSSGDGMSTFGGFPNEGADSSGAPIASMSVLAASSSSAR